MTSPVFYQQIVYLCIHKGLPLTFTVSCLYQCSRWQRQLRYPSLFPASYQWVLWHWLWWGPFNFIWLYSQLALPDLELCPYPLSHPHFCPVIAQPYPQSHPIVPPKCDPDYATVNCICCKSICFSSMSIICSAELLNDIRKS